MVKWLDKIRQWFYNKFMATTISPENLNEVVEDVRQERDEEIRRKYRRWKKGLLPPGEKWTVDRLAEKYKISKQRVSQILGKGEEDEE